MLFRFASAAALAASLSMAATPLSAAELPQLAGHRAVEAPGVFDADAVNADGYRRWHRRDRVDAGDVIGGILVLGTIAAVASAGPPRPARAILFPSIAVTIEADSPGVFSKIDVVDPPYIAP